MVGGTVPVVIQTYAAARTNHVQWMATGQSGGLGKSVLEPVAKETRPEPELAVTQQLNMADNHVMAMLWNQSCVTSGCVQWEVPGALGFLGALAVKLVGKVLRPD